MIFTDTFFPANDGVVTSIINSTRILAQKGHKFIIIAPDYNNKKRIKLHPNIKIVRIKSMALPNYKEYRFVLPNYRKCLKVAESFKPDIIHIETYAVLGLLGAKVANKLKIPLIGTYHTIVAEFTKYFSPISLLGLDKLFNTGGGNKPGEREPMTKKFAWFITLNLFNKCKEVIVPSKAIKRELEKRGLNKKIIVVSNGVNLSLFTSKKNYSPKLRKIVHVGRISYEKNVDQTIKAFALISEKYPLLNYEIIGSGPAVDSLKELVLNLKLENKVAFRGLVPHNNLPEHYKKSDLFITASTMETQGLVILEAMASGLPIIGVDAYAVPDSVKNNINGFIVKKSDIESMAKKMEEFIKNPSLLKKLGKNSVKISKEHEIKKCTLEMEKVYINLIKNE